MAEQFPTTISYGSSGGPMFATEVVERRDGVERRNANWSLAQWRWNVAPGLKGQTEFEALRAFFLGHQGRYTPFRYKDWLDYQLTEEEIGRGNGSVLVFNIAKRYHGYSRRIYRIVSGTLHVYVNGAEKTETTHWTADYDTGVVTFTAGNAPAVGYAVTVTCEFDVYARFDTDQLPSSYEQWQLSNTTNVSVVEVRE